MMTRHDVITGFDASDVTKFLATCDAGTSSQIRDILGIDPGHFPPPAGALFGLPIAPTTPPNMALPEIVLLHGITDCHLANVNGRRNRIWLDFIELFKGRFTRDLPLQADGVSDQPGVRIETDGHVGKKYDRALAAWAAAGFRNHVFCYDWRRSVTSAADQFSRTLRSLTSVQAGEKVVLVAHSMGGLVASVFASRNEDWDKLVHHCVFVGSPLGGSYSVPMAVLGHSPSFQQMNRLSIRDSLTDFQKMAASFPGLLDMLPNPEVMPEAADFYSEAGWPGLVKPLQTHLNASLALKSIIWQSPIFAKSTHIISQGHATPSAMPWNAAATSRAANVTSQEGDGAALTKSSLAPGLKVYLASGEHGTLVNEPRIYNAVMALACGKPPDLPVFDPTAAAAPATRPVIAAPLIASTVVPAGLAVPGIPLAAGPQVALAREIRLGNEMALHFSSESAVQARTQVIGQPGFDRSKLTDSVHLWPNALSLAIASLDAYRSDQAEMSVRAIKEWGFLDYEPFDKNESQGFVCWDNDVVVLSFRGTEQKISDWLRNFKITSYDTVHHGKIHQGFYDGYKAIESDVKGLLKKADANSKKLWITGHSLGGALAAVAGAKLHDEFQAYGFSTYGQPKLGGALLADFYKREYSSRYFRFKNNNDIVTRVPPGFDHVGKLYWFDHNGELLSQARPRGLSIPQEVLEVSAELTPVEFDAMQTALDAAATSANRGGLSLPLADYQVEGLSLVPTLGISDHSIAGKYIPVLRKYL